MSRMKIKLCGLFRAEDIEYANLAGPDFGGFILTPGFRRSITGDLAAAFRRKLDPQIQAVGVFVNAPCEEIVSYLKQGTIQIAQLHGDEREEEIRKIRAISGKPVIKAVKVQSRQDVEAWLDSEADSLLFDSGMGTGQTFDWSLLSGMRREFFLAGGLNADNLRKVMESVSFMGDLRPYAVDLSSGVETNGFKDRDKMQEVVKLVRDGIDNSM